MKICAHRTCDKPPQTNRHKYCSSGHKYMENSMRKDDDKGKPPARKRNKNYFSLLVGSTNSLGRGQGRRSGGMVKGSMAAIVRIAVEKVVEGNKENIERHLKGIPGCIPRGIRLGDGTYVSKENIKQELNIKIDIKK